MTWRTQNGVRILKGAEAALFREMMYSLAESIILEMVDDFGQEEFGIRIFDGLEPITRLALLAEVSWALLRETESPPPLRAINESVIGALFVSLDANVNYEIDNSNEAEQRLFWRSRVITVFQELGDTENLPDANCDDPGEWDILIEILADMILWDRDFMDDDLYLDKAPEHADYLKGFMAIDPEYFTAVPPDPKLSEFDRIRGVLDDLYRTETQIEGS